MRSPGSEIKYNSTQKLWDKRASGVGKQGTEMLTEADDIGDQSADQLQSMDNSLGGGTLQY